MYPKRSSFRFPHKVDIQSKTTTENDMGQQFASWATTYEDVKCSWTPAGSSTSIRNTPTAEEADFFTILFAHDADISYQSRLVDVRDKSGDTIYAGPLQVVQIDKHLSFSGTVQYIQVKAKSVIE